MALCEKPCCNAAARDAIRKQREAEFEAWLAAREASKAQPTLADAEWKPDPTYEEAIARIGKANEAVVVRILSAGGGYPLTAKTGTTYTDGSRQNGVDGNA